MLGFQLGRSFWSSVALIFISKKVEKAEAAMDPWLKEVTEGKPNIFGRKLTIPLRYEYTEANLSFAGLKKGDIIVAEVLRSCKDHNKRKWLDLHLCLVTKHVVGNASPRGYWDSDCGDPDHHTMCEVEKEDIETKNWIGLDDVPSEAFEGLDIDMEKEAVVESERDEPFDDQLDDACYMDKGSGPTLEHWYHRAMLVVWPKEYSFLIACEAGISSAVDLLESNVKINDPSFRGHLHQILSYCEDNAVSVRQAWRIRKDSDGDLMSPRLLNLCSRVRGLEEVVLVLEMLTKNFRYKPLHFFDYRDKEKDLTFKIGFRSSQTVKEIASIVQEFGWETLSSHIINLVKDSALIQGDYCAQLSNELTSSGNKDAGAIIANSTLEVFEALTGELELHQKPVFSWRQPLAKLPEYPEIENFLKGPEETYVHRGLKRIGDARTFAAKYFSHYADSAVTGYSATATPGGRGGFVQGGTKSGAFCTIQKTRRAFECAVEHWHKEQEEIKSLRLQFGKLRSIVPQNTIAAVNITPSPDESCQVANMTTRGKNWTQKSLNDADRRTKRRVFRIGGRLEQAGWSSHKTDSASVF